jgi:hypothetical protein
MRGLEQRSPGRDVLHCLTHSLFAAAVPTASNTFSPSRACSVILCEKKFRLANEVILVVKGIFYTQFSSSALRSS